jgi:hypothetical protein
MDEILGLSWNAAKDQNHSSEKSAHLGFLTGAPTRNATESPRG